MVKKSIYCLILILINFSVVNSQNSNLEICSNIDESESGLLTVLKNCDELSAGEYNSLSFVLNQVEFFRSNSFDSVPNIFPGPPANIKSEIEARNIVEISSGQTIDSIRLHYPEETFGNTPFNLISPWYYKFTPFKVPYSRIEEITNSLRKIENSELFGRYKPHTDYDLPHYFDSDYVAQYVRKIPISDESIININYLKETDLDEEVLNLWGICYIPVDNNWIPTLNALNTITPIAFETTKGMYLMGVTIETGGAHGGNIDSFEGKIFDLSEHSDSIYSYENVVITFKNELSREFASSPLLALDEKRGLNPNQFRVSRKYERSFVLKGFTGPYFELSTYTVVFWRGPNGTFLGSGEAYHARGGDESRGKPSDQVYMSVSHSLQVSVGKNGKYSEPNPSQYSDYQKEIQKAIDNALFATANKFNSSIKNGIIIFK